MPAPRIPLLVGFGMAGYKGRFSDPVEVQKWVDIMVEHGLSGIDTSRLYCQGTSEELISALDLKNVSVDTKIYPTAPGAHEPSKLKETFQQSLQALGKYKIRIFYLHAPDRSVPFEDTLEAVNELYKTGHFQELGLSNYMSFEVAEIVGICKRRGFVQPTVYQGIYNILTRSIEPELFPCLRKYGIRFAAYTALAGGYLTGKLLAPSAKVEQGSHFDPKWELSSRYVARYMASEVTRQVVQELKDVADKYSLQLTEVAYRWLQHHSELKPGDHGIVLGISRPQQLEDAIRDNEKGPLPKEVVDQCDAAWLRVRAFGQPYWH